MKPHQKLNIKIAVGFGLVGVLVPVSFTIATGQKPEIATVVFVVCQFVALSTILFTLLTIHRISLLKMAVGLSIEGVLAYIFLMLGGGFRPDAAWLVPIASGLFAIFEIAALACVVIVLINVSKNPRNPRAAKAAKVILQLFFPFTGFIVGGFCGGLFVAWLFCAFWESHMDMCGLAGLWGMGPGAIGGLLTGQWLEIRFGK